MLCVACRTVPGNTQSEISGALESIRDGRDELAVAQDITGSIEATVDTIGECEAERAEHIAESNNRALADAGDLEAILVAIRELVEEGLRECEDGREENKSP